MPRVAPAISTFDGGEWAPELYGRTDLPKYPNSQRICSNFIPLTHGPLTRRPGFRYVAATKADGGGNDQVGELIPFKVATIQAYQIEATPNIFRFYRNRGRLEQPAGTPIEVTTPYGAADLASIKYAQSQDALYLFHPNYAPRKLSRLSATQFVLTGIDFRDGPYLDANTGNITLTPSAATLGAAATITAAPNSKAVTGAANNGSGAVRLSVVAHGFATNDPISVAGITGTTEANGNWKLTKVDADHIDLIGSTFTNAWISGGTVNPNLFAATDVGRLIRIRNGTTPIWGYAKITGFTNSYTVTAEVKSAFGGTTGATTWRLGAWSDTTGWPVCGTFHQERLWCGGTKLQPQGFWASVSGDYENYALSGTDGTITADSGMAWIIQNEEVQTIRWMSAGKVLNIGTESGEFTVQASNLNEGITPTNITVNGEGTVGSVGIAPVRIGGSVIHVQAASKKLYSTAYDLSKDAWVPNEMSLLWRHLSRRGIGRRAFQKEPWSIIWIALNDGGLIGFTYLEEPLKMAAHRHPLGGVDAKVLSLSCIPGDGQDELWAIIERTINGKTRRYVEYMEYERWAIDENDKADWFFLDAGLTYSGAPATTISGLDHLEGQIVRVLADGAAHPDCVVSGGAITLTHQANKVQVGLGYTSRFVTQDLDAGNPEGSSIGRPKRIDLITVLFLDSLGGKVGSPSTGDYETIYTRSGADKMNQSPPLFSGPKRVPFPDGYDKDNGAVVEIIQDQPLPMTVLAMVPRLTAMPG